MELILLVLWKKTATAIKELKINEAAGPDAIENKIIQILSDSGNRFYLISVEYLLFKKGDKADINNCDPTQQKVPTFTKRVSRNVTLKLRTHVSCEGLIRFSWNLMALLVDAFCIILMSVILLRCFLLDCCPVSIEGFVVKRAIVHACSNIRKTSKTPEPNTSSKFYNWR